MIVKLLTESHLEFLSLEGGYTGSSESTLVKMSNCWKSHALAHIIAKFCKKKYVWKGNVTVIDHRPTHGTARKRYRTITATQKKKKNFSWHWRNTKMGIKCVFFLYLETLFFLIVHPILLVSDLKVITVLVVLCLSPAEGK